MPTANETASTAEFEVFVVENPRPDVNIVCIPDIHADPLALALSLLDAGMIKKEGELLLNSWEITQKGKTFTLILLGDLLDRGPDNLGALQLLSCLQDAGMKIEIVLGNHDADWLRTLKYESAEQLWEKAIHHELRLKKHIIENKPLMAKDDFDGLISENRQLLVELLKASDAKNGESLKQYIDSTFLNPNHPIGNIICNMHAAIRHNNMLFVHSDVSQIMVDDLLSSNETMTTIYVPIGSHVSQHNFHACLEQKSRKADFLSAHIRSQLHSLGIFNIVRGHDINTRNPRLEQKGTPAEPMNIWHLDAGMCCLLAANNGKSQSCFVQFETNERYIGKRNEEVFLTNPGRS